jgi:hypothetical protein
MKTRLWLLVPLLVLAGSPRAPFRLEERLPAETVLFAELPSGAGFREAFKKTRLHAFLEDEEIRVFTDELLEAVLRDVDGFSKDFEAAAGVPLAKAWEIPDGQIAVAVGAPKAEGPADAVLTIDCPGKGAVLPKLVAFARKAHDDRSKEKAAAWKLGGADAVSGALSPGWPLHWAALGDTLVVASSRPAIEALAGAPPAAPLATSARFLQAREKSGAREAFLYADVGGFLGEVKRRLGEERGKILTALGLDGLTYAAGGVRMDGASVTERFFLGTKPDRKGLARFLSLKGAAPGFDQAPEGALQFSSMSIDLAELYDTLLEMLKEADAPGAARLQDQVTELEKQAGLTLKGDVFPAFGPRIFTYSALPPEGLLPDGVTVLEIRDAAKFDACLKAVLQNTGAELAALDFRGKQIRYFQFAGAAGFDPARLLLSNLFFVRDGERLVLSGLLAGGGFGGPNALKRHLLRAGRPTLAATPSVRDWLGGKTGDASLVYYLDLERGFGHLYGTLAPFGASFRSGLRDLGVDLGKLPLGETVGRYLSQIVHRVHVEADGLRVEGVSASGTTLMTAVYGGSAAALLLPAIARYEAREKTSGCVSALTNVFFAMAAHQDDKKEYPKATGQAFFKALKDGGYLDEIPVCPHAGRAAWRGPAMDVNGLDELDAVAADDPASHPDGSINVLQKGGDVATLKAGTPEFKRALETTKAD